MKIIAVAVLFLVCVACATVVAGSTETPAPQPTATAAVSPDYGPCLTVLAYLASSHYHSIYEDNPALSGLNTSPAEVKNVFKRFGGETPQSLIDSYCAGMLDQEVLSAITAKLNAR